MPDSNASATRETAQPRSLPRTPKNRHRGSFEASESSASGSQRNDGFSPSSFQTGTDDEPVYTQAARKRRDRTNGSFLLPDAGAGRRSLRRKGNIRDSTRLQYTPESFQSASVRGASLQADIEVADRPSSLSSRGSIAGSDAKSLNRVSPSQKHPSPAIRTSGGMDAESAQIVQMALNLSESRRMTGRRTVSRAMPPRLTQVPDSSTGNELRRQLVQNRRSSGNLSPKPSPVSPRLPSGVVVNPSLQAALDINHGSQYQYYFSPSTLARAQKAKDQLDLMAQYRRLLDVLPPLKPTQTRPAVSSPPGSPLGAAKKFSWSSSSHGPTLGRKYNPLQYIRNRKVRAREGRVIDGAKQGFGDADSVRLWVDKIHERSKSSSTCQEDQRMPPFPAALSPDTSSPNATDKAIPRARRTRLDWFIEPCDMIADTYWLDEDHNKEIIEDRQWRKIFPPHPDLQRPLTRQTDDASTTIGPSPMKTDRIGSTTGSIDAHPAEQVQFIHSKRGLHAHETVPIGSSPNQLESSRGIKDHKSNSKKGSVSQLSDSDQEAINRNGKVTSDRVSDMRATAGSSALQKQMLDFIAQEPNEPLSKIEIEHLVPPSMVTPEKNTQSKPSSRLHSRRGSLIDISDSDRKATFEKLRASSPPRFRFGRHDRPDTSRAHADVQSSTSLPVSPELGASHTRTEPVLSMELPRPWSRPGSPTRNPITKIRRIVHEKVADGQTTAVSAGLDEDDSSTRKESSRSEESLDHDFPIQLSHKKSATAPVNDFYKGHRRTGSLRQRYDDQVIGLRGMFKGPRIDNVIRGGVSKLGDILRMKEGPTDLQGEIESTDESENETSRGRQQSSLTRPSTNSKAPQEETEKRPKHYLDVMPEFHHASGGQQRQETENMLNIPEQSSEGPLSRQSSRHELLKPPKIHVQGSSPSSSPPRLVKSQTGDSEFSETELGRNREVGQVDQGEEQAKFSNQVSNNNRRQRASRQWSIAGSRREPDKTQPSKRELARIRTLILSSGIKAMEINRRAHEAQVTSMYAMESSANRASHVRGYSGSDIIKLCLEQAHNDHREVKRCEVYPLAAETLANSVQSSARRWQSSVEKFTSITSPELYRRISAVRSKVGEDLPEMTRKAAADADEISKDLALDQTLKVKQVVDTIEKMLRRRRRRLRWVRRALWLMVEWLLVGFMWYVWFMVMILRIFLGIGKGFWNSVRWLLWL